ncbi:CRP/FNR family transcriptional regulator [Lachnotalea glycerini]|uniref:CRP/FNR family transcriptional regulator n=1 Tax=Lachnotalea glycerini TaxID=1763509 RepID=A0A255HZA1_9FIRM|nr:Crp/Fnr family transcriptional regulator [Lachnotalea glycerini]PXV87320.1 CRP/FNR family transcriptional regulator [Lachnotalea glycerini]RDY30468.1 Crp/Fnr family transcriptional regulator [Lachnotalea glycerini]
MEDMIFALQNSVLCKGMSEEQISNFINTSRITKRQYNKGSIIFHEQDKPVKLYLLMEGRVSICKDTMSGRKILITEITRCGDIFGEIYLYMQKEQYNIYATVQENAKIMEFNSELFAMKKGMLEPSHIIVFQNILMLFAQKAYNMNMKLQVLSSGNLRQCLVRFLFNQQMEENVIQLCMTREAMAEYLNVARQSLSREFGEMQEEGLIKVNKKTITILDQEKLEEYL